MAHDNEDSDGAPIVQTVVSARTKTGGRPSVYTSELSDRIVDDVRSGQHLTTAARRAGIHPNTLLRWMERGASDHANGRDTQWSKLAARLDEASAEAEARVVEVFASGAGAKEPWRAAEAYLVRRFPERWATTRVSQESGMLGLDIETATREELEHAIAAFDGASAACRDRLRLMEESAG